MKKILLVLVVVGLGWAVWHYVVNSEGETPYWEKIKDTVKQDDKKTETKDDTNTEDSAAGTVWMGRLEKSSDPKRGNYMLTLQDSDRVVFINTSRDYSAFEGKDVKVQVDGDFSGFSLLDIQAQ